MYRFATRLYIGLVVAAAIWVTPPAVDAQDFKTRIERYLAGEVETRGIPGLSVAVVRDGRVIYSGAHGVGKLGETEKLTPRHVFHFASVSKLFVATAIMQLVEEDTTSGRPRHKISSIFQPLRRAVPVDSSSFIYPEIKEALRTNGHVGNPAKVSDVYPYNRPHAPSSTLNSSVVDMVRWMLVNLNRGELDGRRILQAKSYDLLWTPSAETTIDGARTGMSWFIGQHGTHRTVFHPGGDTGFRSYIFLMPDDGIGIVLASNWNGTPREALVAGIRDILLASVPGSDIDTQRK